VGEQTPQVAEVPVVTTEEPAAEETLLGMQLLRAQAPTADLTTAEVEIQIPTWNLGERIPIAPQIWDADTSQIVEGTADEDVDIVTMDEAVPESPKKSPKEKRRKKRKRSAHQDPDGRRASPLQREGPADTAETGEDEGQPDNTVEILEPASVHSAEDGAVLATEVASVQEPERPVLGMGEVRPTDGEQPFVETVDAPAPSMEDHTPEEEATHQLADMERMNEEPGRNLVPVVLSSSLESTAAMVAVVRENQQNALCGSRHMRSC
jgi:hypothetical protein